MKAVQLLALMAGLVAASAAGAQQHYRIGGYSPPGRPGGGFHGHRGFAIPWIVDDDRVVVVEREVIREVPVAPAAPPPPPAPPRKPWALGASYDSLPSGCMKMLSDGAAFYNCSGEWYRQVAAHSYKAVEGP